MWKKDYSEDNSRLDNSYKFAEDLSTMMPIAWSGLENTNTNGNR